MTVLPVAERELRSAARRPGAYWSRLIAALTAIGIAAWLAYIERFMPAAQLGSTLFATLSGLVFVVALFAGVGFTADTVSAERREGTLGLLFLTDLKPWDVITGKLAASSLGAFYGIVAVMPVLAIPLLLGGVTGTEYFRVMITVLNTLMWSLSAGMFVSTFHTESKTATNQAFGLVFAGAALCPGIGGLLGAWLSNRGVSDEAIKFIVGPLICLSPGAAFAGCFDATFGPQPLLFFAGNGVVLGGSFLFLFLAGRRLPGCWQNETVRPSAPKIAGLVNADANTGPATPQFRRHLLESSPLVWLVCRRWWRRATPWLFIIATLVAYVTMGLWVGSEWWEPPSYIGLSLFLHLIFKLWISGEAPRQIFEDRKSGAMELLLTLPLTERDFIKGHVRALIRLFLRPLIAVAVLDVLCFALSVNQWRSNESLGDWTLTWLMREWFLVVDVIALGAIGLWHGASTRRSRIQGYPFFVVVIVPWLVVAVLATVIYAPYQGTDPMTFAGRLCIWWMIGTSSAAVFGFLHWKALTGRFREAASTRPGEKKPVNPTA